MPTDSPVVHAEDKRLVALLLAGDERAFRQFFSDHYARLYRFALARMGRDTARSRGRGAGDAIARRCKSWRATAARRSSSLGCAPFAAPRSRSGLARAVAAKPHVVLLEDHPDLRAAVDSLVSAPSRTPRLSSSASSARATSKSRSIGCRRATATRSSGSTSKASPRKRSRGSVEHRPRGRELVARPRETRVQRNLRRDARAVERRSAKRSRHERRSAEKRSKSRRRSRALFGRVAARERPSEAAEAAAFAALHFEWRERTRDAPAPAARAGRIAAAASLLSRLAAFGCRAAQPIHIGRARYDRARRRRRRHLARRPVASAAARRTDASSLEGERLATGPATRVALRWHDGGSLRLDSSSRLELVSDRRRATDGR